MSAATTLAHRDAKAASPTAPSLVPATPLTNQQQECAWLETLAAALNYAANTVEATAYSGESDRLLRVAHELADHLFARPDEAGSCATVGNRAYTIASLIKAALQVPGDTPSAERLAFVEQTRGPLVALTGDPTVLDGWETYPAQVAKQRDTAVVDAPSSDAAAILPSDVHDNWSSRLDRAEAALYALVHVFGGDAGIAEPGKCPGLHGTLQHAKWLLSGLHLEIMRIDQPLPDDLRWRTFEASELVNLLEQLEFARGFQFDKWSEGRICMYFDAAMHSVRAAQAALETVKVI